MRHLIEQLEEFTEKAEKSGREKFNEQHGIVPNGNSTGFSEKEQKWYGWSHRATYGFGIGHTVKEGNMPEKYMGKTAKTIADCKKFAIAFADEVG